MLTSIYYFGTFNPVHNGHVELIKRVIEQSQHPACVIPSSLPPNKQGEALLPFDQRYALWQAMLKEHPTLNETVTLNSIEATLYQKRQQPNYTVHTLESLAGKPLDKLPPHSLHFLMGEDTLYTLPTWREAKKLVQACTFWVYPRGEKDPAKLEALSQTFGETLKLQWLTNVSLQPVSATALRDALAQLNTPTVSEALKHTAQALLDTWLPKNVQTLWKSFR